MKFQKLGLSLYSVILLSFVSCGKNEQVAVSQEEKNTPVSSDTSQVKSNIDWDKKLDKFEELIDRNNALIQRIEKGDSTAIAEQEELQKERKELEKDINPFELREANFTPEQVERLAELQKKQRQETTSR